MAAFRADLRSGWRIARVEVRRSVRWYFGQPRAKLSLALLMLFFGAMLLFGAVPVAYALGRTDRVEEQFPLLTAFRQQTTVLLGGLLVLFAFRTVERGGRVDAEPFVLTSTTPRAVVVGVVTAEAIRLLLWLGVPTLLVLAAFAAGAQTPAVVPAFAIGIAPMLAFAAVAGYGLGIGLLYVGRYVPLPSSIKTVLYPLAFVVLIVGSQVVPRLLLDGDLPVSLAPLERALLRSPLAAYADVFLLGTPVARPLSLTAVAGLGAFLAGVPLGATAVGRLAARFWTTEPSRTRFGGSATPAATTPTTVPRPFAWRKSGRIAWHYLRSGLRAPQRFAHLAFLLFAFAPVATSFVESGAFAYVFGLGASIVFGALLAGAAFGLNPFGDEQRALPLLLLTATPPKRFVRGRLVAGVTLCLPFTAGIPFAFAAIGPLSLADAAPYVAVGLVLAVLSAAWAVGLGTAFPRYESRKVYGVESVVPSFLVLFGHNAAVGILGIVALVLTGIGHGTGALTSGSVLVGLAVALLVLSGTAFGSYVYAVRRYRAHDLDRD